MIVMKNSFLFCLGLAGLLFISCDKDDDHHDSCHECHLEMVMTDGTIDHCTEIGEFCGEDLHDVEENGWVVTEAFGAFEFDGVTYEVGHLFTSDEVHCEEHADHDHDH